MEYREYRTKDKSEWGDGPWQQEPDKIQFTDEATGLPCLIVRGPSGALCGYVGIAKGHQDFEKHYDAVPVECHWGLTFSDFCAETGDESKHICHRPEPGEPDHVWWLGFDCAHSGDHCPKYDRDLQTLGTYRTVAYVKRQIASIASQLAERA
ncbi:hypothetical protein [Achromobacter aloeverae]|uniref:Uncharacterized protein n=1 Tax=Achromobacter aloeverae TaxID=1750518 RepID=A0A4Q1HID0_9BURK|nr:hypothetical protein [Achromobacter aloeverae]RXN87992.1 hypothetical protein C7R54_15560 [Achromobacter aloeverae]